MIRFESSTKINFISPALRAWGWGTLLIMQWASEVAYLSSYQIFKLKFSQSLDWIGPFMSVVVNG